ncbi:MAG: XRE family transcriptional regulator [Alphaproteobacteria bacterium]
MPKVNPEVLIWARTTAGLSLAEAAIKLGMTEPGRLESLERGERNPSRRQLVKMAERYRRPLIAFYLPAPPRESDRGQDFRTLPDGRTEAREEPLLNALLRDVHARQGLVRAALEEADEDQPLAFVGSAHVSDGVNSLVRSMRGVLGLSLDEFRAQGTVVEAFAKLRAATEKAGVFVVLMGNLGTHHTDIDPRVFRGIALSDAVAPFVVINEKDSKAAWSFTLLHELTHVWLGQTGISGYDGEAEVEKLCDAVAARFLLDPSELDELRISTAFNLDDLRQKIGIFAQHRNLSRKMVAYNLMRSRLIQRSAYSELCAVFDTERLVRSSERPGDKGGPDYYVVRRHRAGPGLLDVVRRMVTGGSLTTTKAGRVLGVKPTSVSRLLDGGNAA